MSASSTAASRRSAEQDNITTFQRMLAACSGSLINSLVATPFDVIRVRLQLQECVHVAPEQSQTQFRSYPLPRTINRELASADLGVTACCRDVFTMPSSVDYCVVSHFDECATEQYAQRQQLFKGAWDGMLKISKNEGFPALWRGLSPTLVMTVPSNVIYFVGYDHLRHNIPTESDTLAPLLAGGVARALASSVVSPLELFRTRLQSVASSNKNIIHSSREAFAMTWDGVKVMVQTQGISTLWRGLTLTLWRDVPFSAVYWMGYEKTRQLFERFNSGRVLGEAETFVQAFASGALSGTFAAFVTTPFDVGKTRRQVLKSRDPAMDGMIPLLKKIVQEEGISGLFKGLGPRIMKVSVSCAIMISFYEIGKKLSMDSNIAKLPPPAFSSSNEEEEEFVLTTGGQSE
ncbi:mitochondrial carrier domain-containing protein [Lipomyces arxii]|uniref:mitochondrial carrier domain-containing protein n=1 Tax=Lipomyces arxii TaxID=56418 RepID=UPI0034CEBCB2